MDDLKSRLPIDIEKLHECCRDQPQLAQDAGEAAAEAKAASRRCKAALEEAKANADREVRNNPVPFGIVKITESAISSAVVLHPDVKKSVEDSIEADLLADRAASVANAFEHRRSMLKIEAELYVNNYWGDVEVKERQMTGTTARLAEAGEGALAAGVVSRKGTRRRRSIDE